MCVRTKALLMYKAPVEGQAKTRLGKSIGDDKAVALYRWLGARQLSIVPENWSREVRYAPEEMKGLVRDWLGDDLSLTSQGEGDLGDRMYRAIDDALGGAGTEKAIVLGADCPSIDRALLLEAEAMLDKADVVIGSSVDGGYYLIGMKAPHEELFRGITWSADSVYQVTKNRIQQLGLSVACLEVREDIDNLDSLRSQRAFIDPSVWAEAGLE
jgi:rSAM/selenodomain-associated transferase 1